MHLFNKILCVFIMAILSCYSSVTYAVEVLGLDYALQQTYIACVGIDDELGGLKKMAGINTAVTAVGIGLGGGATAVGIAKQKTDKEIAKLEELLQEMEELSAKYTGTDVTDKQRESFLEEYMNAYDDVIKDNDAYAEKIDVLTEKSKTLGNWRTGLLIGNTTTNIASAIISSKTKNNHDLQNTIDNCILNVKQLGNAIAAARMEGQDTSEAQAIYEACRQYEYVDVKSINKHGNSVTIASSIGAGIGGIGAITSGIANSDNVRNDNSDTGKTKEKNLNTASNVFAIGATTASGTATVLNAMQISAIKKISKVSEACTEVLK